MSVTLDDRVIAYPFAGVGIRNCSLALRRQMVVRF
jgi:hypothetical protein